MIGSTADLNINIGGQVYRFKDLYNKTLYASREIGIYKTYLSAKPFAKIKPGEIAGRVQGYIANGYKGAKMPFIIVGDNSQQTQLVPYSANNFSANKLDAQGVKTAGEQAKKEDAQADAWYIKSLKTLAPWLVVGLLGYGYLKRKV